MPIPTKRRVMVNFDSLEMREHQMEVLRKMFAGGLKVPDSTAIRRAIAYLTRNE